MCDEIDFIEHFFFSCKKFIFTSIGKLSISKYRYAKHPHLISVLNLELQIRDL